jgi:hypothetical protein
MVTVAVMQILLATTAAAAPAKPPEVKPPEGKPIETKPADPRAMLAKVVKHVKTVGRKQAFFEFTARKPPFFEAGTYVVCIDTKHVVVAHGGFPTYVGSASLFKDKDGTMMPPAIWNAVTKGDGVVRYTIRGDETNNTVEQKVGYFARIKGDVCGVVAHGL